MFDLLAQLGLHLGDEFSLKLSGFAVLLHITQPHHKLVKGFGRKEKCETRGAVARFLCREEHCSIFFLQFVEIVIQNFDDIIVLPYFAIEQTDLCFYGVDQILLLNNSLIESAELAQRVLLFCRGFAKDLLYLFYPFDTLLLFLLQLGFGFVLC